MSSLTLYFSPTSPYVRKVMILLHEAEQADAVALVPAQGTPLDSTRMPLAQNPLGKVPVLERSDGPALYDSRVICRYLDGRFGMGLYPEGDRLWAALTLEALADGVLDAALAMTYENRLRPEAHRSPEIVEAYWVKIARTVQALEDRWMADLSGRITIAQIAVVAALGYLDLRHDARAWRSSAPHLAAWFTVFSDRPSYQATLPPAGA